MFNVVIIAPESASIKELVLKLKRNGLTCLVIADRETAFAELARRPSDLVLLDIASSADDGILSYLSSKAGRNRSLSLIALVPAEALASLGAEPAVSDFVVKPFNSDEVLVRVVRLLSKTRHVDGSEVINCGDLTIDTASCEVCLDGRLVDMTFKEYELLTFLVTHRGRVFSRQALLDRVWGHDYFGGDRTVDVHVRRLRSKIEESGHSFIETVRNIGYKFKRHS